MAGLPITRAMTVGTSTEAKKGTHGLGRWRIRKCRRTSIGQLLPTCGCLEQGTKRRNGDTSRQDWINRKVLDSEEKQPQTKTFAAGLDFIRRNHEEDNWFLQVETFDPHEPFFTQQKYKDLYPHEYNGKLFDWPSYREVEETPEEVQHLRYEYAALLSMCDEYLGKVYWT